MGRLRTAVLISGRGSNMGALLRAAADHDFPAEIALVVSNTPKAGGIALAGKAGVPTCIVEHRGRSREAFENELQQALTEAEIEFICLAGFMRILTPEFVERWTNRLINIHPSLLPAFKGIHVHERVIAAGVRFSGCTVHFVRPDVDDGPIIVQAAVPVSPEDTPETLAAAVLAAEHRIYPLALRWIAERRVTIENQRVLIDGAETHHGFSVNPAAAK